MPPDFDSNDILKKLQEEAKTDHDILIRLKEDTKWIKEMLGNHLKHHWAFAFVLLSALLGSLVTIITLVVKGAG